MKLIAYPTGGIPGEIFDSAGESLGYISLDQARVLALRHARDNPDFYGSRYARRELAWEVSSAGKRPGMTNFPATELC